MLAIRQGSRVTCRLSVGTTSIGLSAGALALNEGLRKLFLENGLVAKTHNAQHRRYQIRVNGTLVELNTAGKRVRA